MWQGTSQVVCGTKQCAAPFTTKREVEAILHGLPFRAVCCIFKHLQKQQNNYDNEMKCISVRVILDGQRLGVHAHRPVACTSPWSKLPSYTMSQRILKQSHARISGIADSLLLFLKTQILWGYKYNRYTSVDISFALKHIFTGHWGNNKLRICCRHTKQDVWHHDFIQVMNTEIELITNILQRTNNYQSI